MINLIYVYGGKSKAYAIFVLPATKLGIKSTLLIRVHAQLYGEGGKASKHGLFQFYAKGFNNG